MSHAHAEAERLAGKVLPRRDSCLVAPEDEPVLVKQEFAEQCDINVIMSRFTRGAEIPQVEADALYGDFSEVGDFLEAQLLVQQAAVQFRTLPAKVRERVGSSPEAMLAFVADEKNAEEARELGLLRPKPGPSEGEVIVETLQTIAKQTAPVVK